VLPYTNNVITIAAQDAAGNQSQATVTVYVDPSTHTNAPTFSVTGFTPNSVIDLPIVPNVWVEGVSH